jgi:hypothetical protein
MAPQASCKQASCAQSLHEMNLLVLASTGLSQLLNGMHVDIKAETQRA